MGAHLAFLAMWHTALEPLDALVRFISLDDKQGGSPLLLRMVSASSPLKAASDQLCSMLCSMLSSETSPLLGELQTWGRKFGRDFWDGSAARLVNETHGLLADLSLRFRKYQHFPLRAFAVLVADSTLMELQVSMELFALPDCCAKASLTRVLKNKMRSADDLREMPLRGSLEVLSKIHRVTSLNCERDLALCQQIRRGTAWNAFSIEFLQFERTLQRWRKQHVARGGVVSDKVTADSMARAGLRTRRVVKKIKKERGQLASSRTPFCSTRTCSSRWPKQMRSQPAGVLASRRSRGWSVASSDSGEI